LAEARRLAEIRRREEEARRARIEAARRAQQALHDETAANISHDLTIGEDPEVRRAAIAALGNHAGSVVVMDPKTGRVYAVVNQEWAVRRGFKPCSTIKLVTGLAGLCENVINPAEAVDSPGGRYNLDLTDSLAYSNNGYFQSVGGRVGFDRMVSYARELGLGEKTGANYPNEYAGQVPLFKSGYAVNHMCSHGDDFEVTPLQLATIVSAIGNGGSLLVPHVPRTPQEDVSFKTEVRRHLKIPDDALHRMIPGMIGAVNYGTARVAYDPTETIAGKTGTCNGQGTRLGLFTSYAPVSNPRLAVVVVTRGSGEKGKVAAGIAGRVYHSLSGRFGTPVNMQMAVSPELTPRPKLDAKTAAAINDEEREADAEDSNGAADSTAATKSATGTATGKVKSVLMNVPQVKQDSSTQGSTTQSSTALTGDGTNSQKPARQPGVRPRRVHPSQP
jgi:penicillin-binding protein 2